MNFGIGLLLGLGLGVGVSFWRTRLQRQSAKRLRDLITHWFHRSVPMDVDLVGMISLLSTALRQQMADQQALEEQQRDWETLSQQMPFGFLEVDENNLVLRCNDPAQRFLRIEHWQPAIKVMLEWVRSYELDQLIEQCRRRSVAIPGKEWLFYPPGGETKPLPLRAWAVPLSHRHVGVFLESRLETRTLSQQRDRWSSDVAHELKTPLTSIRLVAETLQNRVDPQLRMWVDRLLEEVIRLSNLVQDLLELSRLNLGAVTALQVRHLNLVPVIASVCQSLEPLATPRGQSFDYQGSSDLWLWGDEQRLFRLIHNLLSNSIKYADADSAIHIRLHQDDDQTIWVDVYDHGSGFPSETLTLIFEPFYRTDHARARTEGGTGLGLAIARQIVEAHGGRIQAANHPETGGAWLRFSLHPQLPAMVRRESYG